MENQNSLKPKGIKLFSALMILSGCLLICGAGSLLFVFGLASGLGGGHFPFIILLPLFVLALSGFGLIVLSFGIKKFKKSSLIQTFFLIGILFILSLCFLSYAPLTKIVLAAIVIEVGAFVYLFNRRKHFV